MRFTFLSLLFLTIAIPAFAQKGPAPPEVGNPAIDYLHKVEAKNSETKALQAEFRQIRRDILFDDTVRSDGAFWYEAPDRFRASYDSEHGSDIWMMDGKIINYLPDLKQVEIFAQESGEEAPVNQLLLGFGIEVERILKIFEVAIDDNLTNKDEIAIVFDSKDLRRSMEFEQITIVFDKESVEPQQLILKNAESIITVYLDHVKLNPKIKEKVFETDWPGDVEVLDYSKS